MKLQKRHAWTFLFICNVLAVSVIASYIYFSHRVAPPLSQAASELPKETALTQVSSSPVPQTVVLNFKPNTTKKEKVAYIRSIGGTATKEIAQLNSVVVTIEEGKKEQLPPSEVLTKSEPDYYISALVNDSALSSSSQSKKQETSFSVNDPEYSKQWALSAMQMEEQWEAITNTQKTEEVTVAVIDSGVCYDHPDLAGRIVTGWDFIEKDEVAQDEFDHGCSVAGIIAANTNNSLGMAGIGLKTKIMPLRVLDSKGVGTYSDLAQAIIKAVDNKAKIINVSLGGPQPSTLLENAVKYAQQNHVTVIAAAGNNQSDTVLYPAAYSSVVAVGSVDPANDQGEFIHSSFSNYGKEIHVWAPGRHILATDKSNSYHYVDGTSFAAAQVSGIYSMDPNAKITLSAPVSVANDTTSNEDMSKLDHVKPNTSLTPLSGVTKNTPVTMDYSFGFTIPEDEKIQLEKFLNTSQSPFKGVTDTATITSFSSLDEWSYLAVLPFYKSRGKTEGFPSEGMMEILAKYDPQAQNYIFTEFHSPAYEVLKKNVPKKFMDLNSSGQVTSQATTNFMFPWNAPQGWWKNQGWHTTPDAIDFQPQNASNFNTAGFAESDAVKSLGVLAPESGTLRMYCDSDVEQVDLLIDHGGATTYFVHLQTSSFNRALIGQTVKRGQYIGHLYTGHVGAGNGFTFNTKCGQGSGIHLHFGTSDKNLKFQGQTLDVIANSAAQTVYTSINSQYSIWSNAPIGTVSYTDINNRQLQFNWDSLQNYSGTYHLHFKKKSESNWQNYDTTNTSYSIDAGSFIINQDYEWNVTSDLPDPDGNLIHSPTQTFKLILSVPQVISPQQNFTSQDREVKIQLSQVLNLDKTENNITYSYQVSTNADFSSLASSSDWQAGRAYSVTLTPGHYYIRAQARYSEVRPEGNFEGTSNWSSTKDFWVSHPEVTMSTFVTPNGEPRLYQAIRGDGDKFNKIFTRYSIDLYFDESIDSEKWKEETIQATSNLQMTVHQGKLYQVVRGTANDVWMRSSNTTSFDDWYLTNGTFQGSDPGVSFKDDVTIVSYSVSGESRLYETVSASNGRIFMRYTKDGKFDNSSSEEQWTLQTSGAISGAVTSVVYNNKLYQFARGGGQDYATVWIRFTTDGNFNDLSTTQENWKQLPNTSVSGDISAQVYLGYLYLVTRDSSADGKITTIRTNADISDSDNLSGWSIESETTLSDVTVAAFDKGPIFEAKRNRDAQGTIQIRSSMDGTFDGNTSSKTTSFEAFSTQYEPWTKYPDGGASGEIMMVPFKGALFVFVRAGSAGEIWYRTLSFDDMAVLYPAVYDPNNPPQYAPSIGWTQLPTEGGVGIKDNPVPLEFNGKLYLAVTGADNKAKITSTSDGVSWLPWLVSGGTDKRVTLSTFTPSSGQKRLYETLAALDGVAYFRYTTDGTTWSGWDSNGGAAYPVTSIEFNGKLYEVVVSSDKSAWMRTTTDGSAWSSWVQISSAATSEVTMVVNNGQLYQAYRDGTGVVNTRRTYDGTNWQDWIKIGGSASFIPMISFHNQVYQALQGGDNFIYTRHSTGELTNSGYDVWTSWIKSGSSQINPTFAVFQGPKYTKLYQAVKGIETTGANIWTRSTMDGEFDNLYFGRVRSPVENWQPHYANTVWVHQTQGMANGEVSQIVYQGKFYQTIVGTDGNVWMRSSTDGNFTDLSNPSENWVIQNSANGTVFTGKVSMAVYPVGTNSYLYQVVRGTDNAVYTRFSDDTNFTDSTTPGEEGEKWVKNGGAGSNITMVVSQGRLFQTERERDGTVWTRFYDGTTWSTWNSNGGALSDITLADLNNTLLFSALRAPDNTVWVRYTITRGDTWQGWSYDNRIKVTSNVEAIGFNNAIYLFATKDTDGKVYMKKIPNGTFDPNDTSPSANWTPISEGINLTSITVQKYGDQVFIVGRATNGHVFTRLVLDRNANVTSDPWYENGGTDLPVSMIEFNGSLYQALKGSEPSGGNMWMRKTSGQSFGTSSY
jgi:thermitase